MGRLQFVIVTGMSGAGKSTAMKMMEDMGFFCIDNLPIPLLDKLVDFTTNFHTKVERIAIGIDSRSGEHLQTVEGMLDVLAQKDVKYEILFLDAEDNVLIKRYKETRRSHPLAPDERVDKGIERERLELAFLKDQADYIIDTSRLLTRELKSELERIFIQFLIPNYISEGKNQLVIAIGCTGGKHRSVTLANELYKRLDGNSEYGLKIEHRDIGKDALRGK